MNKRLIYYDTETTGVRPDFDRIVEIAAYDPLQNKSFTMLVNPGIAIPKEASNIHGITDETVKNAPTFAEAGARFMEFCQGDVILVAHNNDQFDKHFLQHECKRHQLALPNFPMLDSLKWARKYRPDLPRHSLQFLRQVYGVEENNAHRALDDVLVLHQIFSVMIDDLPLDIVLKLMEEKNGAVMPSGKHQGKPLNEIPEDYILWLGSQGFFDKPENQTLKIALQSLGKLNDKDTSSRSLSLPQ